MRADAKFRCLYTRFYDADLEPGQVNGTETQAQAEARGVYSGATPSSASSIQSAPGLTVGIVRTGFASYSSFYLAMSVCMYIAMS